MTKRGALKISAAAVVVGLIIVTGVLTLPRVVGQYVMPHEQAKAAGDHGSGLAGSPETGAAPQSPPLDSLAAEFEKKYVEWQKHVPTTYSGNRETMHDVDQSLQNLVITAFAELRTVERVRQFFGNKVQWQEYPTFEDKNSLGASNYPGFEPFQLDVSDQTLPLILYKEARTPNCTLAVLQNALIVEHHAGLHYRVRGFPYAVGEVEGAPISSTGLDQSLEGKTTILDVLPFEEQPVPLVAIVSEAEGSGKSCWLIVRTYDLETNTWASVAGYEWNGSWSGYGQSQVLLINRRNESGGPDRIELNVEQLARAGLDEYLAKQNGESKQ